MDNQEYHEPVLLNESVSGLITDTDGVYIDGTLGGGGHSKAILEKLSENATLYGIDQDDEALAEAKTRLGNDIRFRPLKGNFGFIDVLIPKQQHGNIHGLLLDLGVSSRQIDAPERGFSFRSEGPLDMRMSNLTGLTAKEVVNYYDVDELKNIIWRYGEEKFSGQIARAIAGSRPLETTEDLVRAIGAVTPDRFMTKTCARVFQALRIEINRELEMLEQVLERGTQLLAEGGRLVVISYHSLEDRLVKNWMKAGNFKGKLEKDFYGNNIRPLSPLHGGTIKAKPEEIKRNPRARSARLRIAEKQETV